jgi:hypothetical protein
MTTRPLLENYTWFPFRNDSGEEIPAWSVLEVTGTVSGAGRATLTCRKPTNSGCTFVSSGPFSVQADKFGDCVVSPHRIVKYTGTVAAGDEIGPAPGQWYASNDEFGMMVLGVIDSANSLALVTLLPKAETCGIDSSSSYGSSVCNTIPGVDLDALDLVNASEADYVLGIRAGCLVKIALVQCDPGSSSAGAGSSSGGGPAPE